MPPNWHREEVVLGLDTYFRHERQHLPKDHLALERLSQELNEIASELHPDHEPADTFRNVDGMHMKLGGYVGIDPTHDSGGTTPSQLEREVFREFLDDRAFMHQQALEIRESLGLAPSRNRWWDGASGENIWIELTDREDLGADLRAPRYDRGGKENWRYTLLLDVQPGDHIYHYHKDNQAIVAHSVASTWARDDQVVWAARGTYARESDATPRRRAGLQVELSELEYLPTPVSLEDLREQVEEIREAHQGLNQTYDGALYMPFSIRRDAEVRPNQAYLAKLPSVYLNLFPQLRDLREQWSLPESPSPSSEPLSPTPSAEGASTSSEQRGGQGYSTSAAERAALERASMKDATEFFESRGYSVEDKSANSPYDLLCTQNNERLYVEVKGTTTNGSSIHLTRGEVEHAREHEESAVLFVLRHLTITENEDGSPVAVDGERKLQWPWYPREDKLNPTQYKYETRW
jgi:hypothetical protein